MLASVIGAVETSILRLDDGVDAIGISSGNGDADPAENSIGKTIPLQAFPCYAVVFRSIQSAAGAAAGEKPRLPPRLPKRREHNVRVLRIENHVDAACVFIFGQNFCPSFAAVTCAKNSALLIRAKCMTQRRYENHILISRIDNERADLPRIFQPNIFPGFATVDGFENSSTIGRVAADGGLPRADIDDVVIRWRHCQSADRRNWCFIKKRSPSCAAVSRLPNSAGNRAEIIRVRLT